MDPPLSSSIIFSIPDLDQNFTTDAEYADGAMDRTVYYFTNSVLQSIYKENILPPDIRDQFDFGDMISFVDAISQNWRDIATENWRFCLALLFGIFMMLIMPIAGLICGFARLYWVPKMSEKQQKYTNNVLIAFGFWVLCTTTILFGIFGSVWYIASNSALQNGIEVLPDKLNNAFDDINLYINNTVTQIDHLAKENFDQVKNGFTFEVDISKNLIEIALSDVKEKIYFEDIVDLSESIVQEILSFNSETIEKIKADVGSLNSTLEANIKTFEAKVYETKEQIDDVVHHFQTLCTALVDANIPDVDCISISILNGNMGVDLDELVLPEEAYQNVIITEATLEATKTFEINIDAISKIILNLPLLFAQNYSIDINEMLDVMSQSIKQDFSEITNEVSIFGFNSSQVPEEVNNYIEKNLTFNSKVLNLPIPFLCVILVILLIGLVLGYCGNSSAARKNNGSIFLAVSLGLFFVLAFFLWLLTLALFFSSVLADKLVCETFRDPSSSSELGPNLEEYFQQGIGSLTSSKSNLTVDQFLENCSEQGEGIYTLFQLDTIYNVSSLQNWRDEYQFHGLKEGLNEIIKQAIIEAIQKMKTSEEINAQRDPVNETLNVLKTNIFDKYQRNLEDVNPVPTIRILVARFDQVKYVADHDDRVEEEAKVLVASIISGLSNLADLVATLQQEFNNLQNFYLLPDYNTTFQLPNSIDHVTELLSSASGNMANSGLETVLKAADDSFSNVVDLVEHYVKHAINYVTQDVGRCGPIPTIYENFLINAVCRDIVRPFSGLWTGLGLILLFSIPGLFVLGGLQHIFSRDFRATQAAKRSMEKQNGAFKVYKKTRFGYVIPQYYRGRLRQKKSNWFR